MKTYRFVSQEVKAGWVVYDTKLMRPVSTTIYSSKVTADAVAAKLN